MITISKETLVELILKSEPDFIGQIDLQMNGYGNSNNYANEDVWVWSKERLKSVTEEELNYLITKILGN